VRDFLETWIFTDRFDAFLDDLALARLQNELAVNPQRGPVIPACGGLRKVRAADRHRGKGKRGGARVIYLDIPEAGCIALVAIYGKDEKEDLTGDDRKSFTGLAGLIRAEALASVRRGRRR
jgi:hypothetical protein